MMPGDHDQPTLTPEGEAEIREAINRVRGGLATLHGEFSAAVDRELADTIEHACDAFEDFERAVNTKATS